MSLLRYVVVAGTVLSFMLAFAENCGNENADEEQIMHDEADAFLGAMPAGLQELQTLAIRKALSGDFVALEEVRNARRIAAALPEDVVRICI